MPFQLPQKFTKTQIIFLIVAGACLILLSAVLMSGRRNVTPPAQLTLWGIDDPINWFSSIRAFEKAYGNVDVEYTQISSANYEEELVNALAAGRGPDIWMIDNDWALKHQEKLIPAPNETLTLADFQGLFPKVAEQDFVIDGQIYALPVFIDTLALVYNRDHFDQNGIVFPPPTWEDLKNIVPKLRRVEDGQLKRAAVAIGAPMESVPYSPELLTLILSQSGVPIIDEEGDYAAFDIDKGYDTFAFYLDFVNASSSAWAWDDSFGAPIEAFSRGEVSAIFAYREELRDLQQRNAFLSESVAPMPQINPGAAVNLADYWGLAVSSWTANSQAAWAFVIFVTTDEASALAYQELSGRPPALRSLINEELGDIDLGVFASQALTARSWPRPDKEAFDRAINGAIKATLSGDLEHNQALSAAAYEISNILRSE